MKKRLGSLLYCLLFGLICLIPSVGLTLFGPSRAASNERLAALPAISRAGRVNWEYLHDLSAYFDGHFALRQELITAHARLTAALFHESATQDVILGSDGWLYYADTLGDYEGSDALSEREIWSAARCLALIREYAAGQGCRFLFTVAPNKNTLYPEAMPERYRRGAADSNLQRLCAALEAAQVPYCDLCAALGAADEPVYYRTDSHWNDYGSALAHDALLAALDRPGALAAETFEPKPHLGDLYEMLYPAGTQTELAPSLQRPRRFVYRGAVRGSDDLTIRTTCADGSGSLVMFRDSFGNNLHADLAEDFAQACFSRAEPYPLELLASEQADYLIIELVERNLGDLAHAAPILPGPVRQLPAPERTLPAELTLKTDDSDAPKGLVRYSGQIRCAEMDLTSPVYLSLDGVIYEASPAGSGENAFTLYAPAAEQVFVLIEADGLLTRLDA